jgi:hypothetical protein
MDAPISPESLLSLGFSHKERDAHGILRESFIIDVYEDDMMVYERMFLWIKRGNGYDPACWDAEFLRTSCSFHPPRPMILRHGLKNMSEVENMLAIFKK